MKKLIIQNLKDCFEFGLSFKDLAEIEHAFLTSEDFTPIIKSKHGEFTFLNAQVNQNGRKVMYYKFNAQF